MRSVLGNYGLFYLVAVVPQQLVLSLVELLIAVVTGRFSRARSIVGGYLWNVANIRSLMAKRKRTARLRQLTDLEIRHLQVHGSARFSAFVRGQFTSGTRPATALSDSGRRWMQSLRRGVLKQNLAVALAAVVIIGFGSRYLVTGGLPVVGEFPRFPSSATGLIRQWWSGWRGSGLGVAASPPFGELLAGVATFVLFGSEGLARTLVVLMCLPLGVWGAWRLGSLGGGPSRSAGVAAAVYLANPLSYNAVANASWRGLAAYAAAPWLLRRLAIASGQAPFETHRSAAGIRGALHEIVVFGLVVGLMGAVYPMAAVWAVGVTVLFAAGSLLAGSAAGSARMALIGLAGSAAGALLHFPALVGGFDNADPDLSLAGRSGDTGGFSLGAALRFAVGPYGRSKLTWGLLLAGLLALIIGRQWRLVWATRAWAVVLGSWTVIAISRTDLSALRFPPPEVTLAPAAAGLALAAGMGAAAFEFDLRGYGFGWRQFASVAASVALVVASLPIVFGAVNGRWKAPRGGWERSLAFLDEQQGSDTAPNNFRVLWLGDSSVLPVAGWPLSSVVAAQTSYATSVGVPEIEGLWVGPEDAAVAWIPRLLGNARQGDTSRLGRDLAPLGIRYVVVVDALAPRPFGGREVPAAIELAATLGEQLDLAEVKVNPAVRVFRNDAWLPLAANLGPGAVTDEALDARAGAAQALEPRGLWRYEGDVKTGDVVYLAQATSPQWSLEVGGQRVGPQDSFQWASHFVSPATGAAKVSYATPNRRRLIASTQIVLWLALTVIALYLRRRQRADDVQFAQGSDPLPAVSVSLPPVLLTAEELIRQRSAVQHGEAVPEEASTDSSSDVDVEPGDPA